MEYRWWDPTAGIRKVGAPGEAVLILPEMFDGSEEAGKHGGDA